MNKEFIPYELALALKELQFDEHCFAYYQKSSVIGNDTILPISFRDKASNFNDYQYSKLGVPFYSAPLYQQAFRWFREKYDKYGVVNIDLSNNLEDKIFVYMVEDKLGYIIDRSEEYNTYEEAELACLKQLIKIIKTK
jgi:hypothetical protein